MGLIARFIARHSPLFILAGICIAFAVASPEFRRQENLQNVATRTSIIAIMAIGQMLVILTAGIDLSVGSVAALSAVVAGLLMTAETAIPVPVAVAAGCGTGLLCGAINGTLITVGRIPPFIVTLGMMMAARGLALIATNSSPVSGLPEGLKYFGGGMPWGDGTTWWIPVLLMLALTGVFIFILGQTRFGRSIYAIGGNLTGARLSGISVNWVRTLAYMLSGLMAGVSGILLAARTSIADPTAATTYELDAIAACVIGGASLMGGEGGVLGSLAGALIMNVLANYCNLKGVDVNWQPVLVGALIVSLVFYDNLRKRRAGLLKE